MSLADLYRQVILEHAQHPRNKEVLEPADVRVQMDNPVCGDEIDLRLRIEDGIVRAAKFTGRGCSISQASASLMTEAIQDKSLRDVLRTVAQFKGMMRGEVDPVQAGLGELEALQGVSRYPVRIKCALLAWTALQKGIGDWEGEQEKQAGSGPGSLEWRDDVEQYGTILYLVVILAVMWLFLIRPQQQQQRKRREMLASLRAGTEIVTVGGIRGRIVALGEDTLRLRVAQGVELELVKSGVAHVVERPEREEKSNKPAKSE